jgi:Protein of unknown function (DUF2500).
MIKDMFYGFDSIYILIIMLVGVVLVSMISFIIIRGIIQWHNNNKAPFLTVNSIIIAKRKYISTTNYTNNNNNKVDTTYYITFEIEDGNRIEFCVPDSKYGLLVEGDKGLLSFKGTRYKGFERLR